MGVFSVLGDKIKVGLSDMKTGLSNIIKKPLRKRKLEFHFRKAGGRRLITYKKYEPMIKYLKGINDQLIEIETRFDKIENDVMPQVEELYRFCGPYTDPELILFEQGYAQNGTIYNIETKEKSDFDEKGITINGKSFKFDMPPAKKVYFPDDHRFEEVVYFGYDENVNLKLWRDKFNEFINQVCEHTVKKVENEIKDTKENERRLGYLNEVRSIYIQRIDSLFRSSDATTEGQTIGGYEKHFHTKYLRTIYDRLISDYSSLMASILKIVPQKIKYKHTYKIAIPVLRGYDGKEKDRLENYGVNPPTDERGMPLEVDDEGRIMIGPNKGKKVPDKMIKYEKLSKIAPWVVNEFDAYRDDLRDGRYHPESLTVMDYIMANNYSAGGEWKTKEENKLKTDKLNRNNDDRKYTMKLHDGRIIEGIRKADNINPAFDLGAFEPEQNGVIGIPKKGKEWIHIGRGYYYADFSEVAVEEQGDPAATSRGTVMYLIDKFESEGMLMDEIHEDLKFIGEFAGFDYGPRKFGAPLCTDPWNIDLSPANISARPYKKKEV